MTEKVRDSLFDVFIGFLLGFVGCLLLMVALVEPMQAHGGKTQKCYPNKTCKGKLECRSNRCVSPNVDVYDQSAK